jgi:hypothetical protein
MGIFVTGMNCRLCGKPVTSKDETTSTAAFVQNEADPLWELSGGLFHVRCFQGHPLAQKAEARYQQFLELTGPGKRVCLVCSSEITNPDEYLPVGFLSEVSGDPLAIYNYAQFHRSCLPKWQDRARLKQLLTAAISSGRVRGKAYDWLVKQF